MVGALTALVVSAAVAVAVWRLGPALGYVDKPDDPSLKVHTRAAVPLGGIAVFSGMHGGLAVAGLFDPWLFVATLLLLVLGLADDRLDLEPKLRLVVELLAGAVLAVGVRERGVVVALSVAILVVVSVNAVNLFDGLDGLAGSTGMLSAVGAALFAFNRGSGTTQALVVVAALVGFLIFNWHPAKLFLGDNGSYVLGLTLVALFAHPAEGMSDLMIGVGLLGMFLIDLVSTVLRRKIAGTPMFLGDRSHTYDRIHAQGRSIPSVVVIVAVLHIAVIAAVLLADRILAPSLAAVAAVVIGFAATAIAIRGASKATTAS